MISVITAASRDLSHMKKLRYCFKQQVFQDFEHIIIYDGIPSEDIIDFFKEEAKRYNVRFSHVTKEEGSTLPYNDSGATPRNIGITQAKNDLIVFCDDDDIYTRKYLQVFSESCPSEGGMIICRMDNYGHNLPQQPLSSFPIHGDIGTPMVLFFKKWFDASSIRWGVEGDHDYQLVKELTDKFKLKVQLMNELTVKVRGNIKEFYPEYE